MTDKDNIKHVMISYNWGCQKQMLILRDKLRAAGYKVWMDVDYLEGSLLEGMAKAVEDSACILVCFTSAYQESNSCRTEAEYAYNMRVPTIPLMGENGYKPTGWLGALIGAKLYYRMDNEEQVNLNFPGLARTIGNKGRIRPLEETDIVQAPSPDSTKVADRPPEKRREEDVSHLSELVSIPLATAPSADVFQSPLGMERDLISVSQITASSTFHVHRNGAGNARLNWIATGGRFGAWSAKVIDQNQWIQVDFGLPTVVTGVILQGRSDCDQWVTKYKVRYCIEGNSWQTVTNAAGDEVFTGNTDSDSQVRSMFATSVKSNMIRVCPTEWHKHISLRMELLGQSILYKNPLGMKDCTICDGQLTASTKHNNEHGPTNARLDRPAGSGRTGAWSAKNNDASQWVQVDLGAPATVSGVILQGRSDYDQWVTKYKVLYSVDDGGSWQCVKSANQRHDMLFTGNSNRDTPVTSMFAAPIQTSLIRIQPIEWFGHVSMRFELLGRQVLYKSPLGMQDGGIEDSQLSASGSYSNGEQDFSPSSARLDKPQNFENAPGALPAAGAWCMDEGGTNPWIQVDLGVSTTVTGIQTQGRHGMQWGGQWMRRFKVQHSKDGATWEFVKAVNKRHDMVFTANTDGDNVVTNYFPWPVQTSYIRVCPNEWENHCSIRFELLGHQVVYKDPLGIQKGTIADSQLTASSQWNGQHGPANARLDRPQRSERTGAWSAKESNTNQWIQVDFGEITMVTGVKIQGRTGYEQWVTRFKVVYTTDEDWECVKGPNKVHDMVFVGNSDRNTVVTCLFPSAIHAKKVRIKPTEWLGHISLRFELLGRLVPFKTPMGMKSGVINDGQITASSMWDPGHAPSCGRLDSVQVLGRVGAWCAKASNSNQWIQVDFGSPAIVSGVVTQGRACDTHLQRVTKYKVQYSQDGSSWEFVKTINKKSVMIFTGNSDQNTPVTNLFPSSIKATLIRICPVAWEKHISMRIELLGQLVLHRKQLGMKDGKIPDSRIKASSEYNPQHGANNARLERPPGDGRTGAWSAKVNDTNQWIEADLGESTLVTGVQTQGRNEKYDQWVIRYKVQYSKDGGSWELVKTANKQHVLDFTGNKDIDTINCQYFPEPVKATKIRILPLEWNNHISMRFELLGQRPGDLPKDTLGMQDSRIQDHQLTASSLWDNNHRAPNARLHRKNLNGTSGAWCAKHSDTNQWIQVDLGGKTTVSGVQTQGRYDIDQWVSRYKVRYSNDGNSWEFVKCSNSSLDMIFRANNDRNTIVTTMFPEAIHARLIRLEPTSWYVHISMRFELLGKATAGAKPQAPPVNKPPGPLNQTATKERDNVFSKAMSVNEKPALPHRFLFEQRISGRNEPEAAKKRPQYKTKRKTLSVTEWCSCGSCRVLPYFKESDYVCCRDYSQTKKLADNENCRCVTGIANFEAAILNPLTLHIAWNAYGQQHGKAARAFKARLNKKYRAMAYRQFFTLFWGYPGKNTRPTTSACAHVLIDNSYPDGITHYRGIPLSPLDV